VVETKAIDMLMQMGLFLWHGPSFSRHGYEEEFQENCILNCQTTYFSNNHFVVNRSSRMFFWEHWFRRLSFTRVALSMLVVD